MPKQQISIRFNPCTIEVMREITGTEYEGVKYYGGVNFESTTRGFLETLVRKFLYDTLKDECLPQLMHTANDYDKLCNLWIKVHRAKRNEQGLNLKIDKGYKLYRGSKKDGKVQAGKIVAVFGPNDLPNGESR